MSRVKTLSERALQALGFELGGIALSTPLFAWLMGAPWLAMGVLTVANCLLALAWNIAFNALFERWLRYRRARAGLASRLLHAVAFEGGLAVFCIPLAAWWLGIGLVAAMRLECGLVLFYLPYTYVYHLGYDTIRARWV